MNRKAATLLEAFGDLGAGAVVVEIGCVRQAHEVPSDGYSTFYLAQTAAESGWELHSVDVDLGAVRNAQSACEGLPVSFWCADGAAWLADFSFAIDGLFLDGAANGQQTLDQYVAATLADRCVIVIDDVQDIILPGEILQRGKGGMLLDRLMADEFEVAIKDTEPGYQMAVAARC